jgi:hypothetical protein
MDRTQVERDEFQRGPLERGRNCSSHHEQGPSAITVSIKMRFVAVALYCTPNV